MSMPGARVARRRWWRLSLTLLAMPVLLLAAPAYRYAFGGEAVIDMQLHGEACGAHLLLAPDALDLAPGQRVRFVNSTQYWPVEVRVATFDSPHAPAEVQSPRLDPGDSWSYVFWWPQRRFVTAANENLYWAGLRGWITVHR